MNRCWLVVWVFGVVMSCGGAASMQDQPRQARGEQLSDLVSVSPEESGAATEVQSSVGCDRAELGEVLARHGLSKAASTQEKFRLGRSLYDKGELAGAVVVFDHVARDGDAPDLKEYALNLALDAHIVRLPVCEEELFRRVVEYDALFCKADTGWEDGYFCSPPDAQVRLVCTVESRQAERLAKKGAYKEATDRFEQLAERKDCEGLAEQSLFNAVVTASKADDALRTRALEAEFRSRFPNSHLLSKLSNARPTR